VSRDDDDRRPDGDGSPVDGEPFSIDDIVIPDDLRELDAEIRALQRERRAMSRRTRMRRLFLTRRWRQYGMSGPIVVGVLLVVAGMASLMLMFPARRQVTKPAPLATGVRPSGQEGGLVPDVTIERADGVSEPLRGYRPAVIALVPASCGCEALLRTTGAAAYRHHLTLVLVGGTSLPPQPPDPGDRTVVRATEPTGKLARTYHAGRTPVLLLVRSDGVVNRVLAEERIAGALDNELAVLAATGTTGFGGG
jgi:hypothetical protein